MMTDRRTLWLEALSQGVVWRKALKFGLTVGVMQAVLNQGDIWLRHSVTGLVVAKTIVSPLLSLSIGLLSAAATYVEKQTEKGVEHAKV